MFMGGDSSVLIIAMVIAIQLLTYNMDGWLVVIAVEVLIASTGG